MQGMHAYCSYIPIFLGTSFIELAYAFMIQEVQYAEKKLIRYILFNVHVTWFTNTLCEKFSSGIIEPFL